MSNYQRPRISRRTAARMLRGTRVTVPDALARLLAAADAPPHDGELTGESAAAQAFLDAAQHSAAPHPRSRSVIRSARGRLLTVKIATAAAALCAVGGVAAAAATGHLTLPSHGSSPSRSGHSAVGASSSSTADSVSGASSTGHHASPSQSSSPSPSLIGLCRAYTAGAKSAHGKALDNPAFTALITSAGGKTKVDAYCGGVLNATSSSTPTTARGADSSAAKGDPGRSATGHKAATDHPTRVPTTHLTGASAPHGNH